MKVDLNRLQVFSTVFIHRNVSKAASSLGISQPAVSQHIKKLEQELRVPLFTRVNRRILPTPAAGRLYNKVAPFLTDIRNEIKYLRRPLDMPYGQLRIGCLPNLLEKDLVLICNHFRFRFPTVSYRLTIENRHNLLESLTKGSLDFALVAVDKSRSHKSDSFGDLFRSELIMRDEKVLVCTEKYFRRNNLAENNSYEHITKLDFLADDENRESLNRWFQHHFRKVPEELNITLGTNSFLPVKNGLLTGIGAGMIGSHEIREELTSGTIKLISIAKTELAREIHLVQLKNKALSLTEQAYISVLKKELNRTYKTT